MISDTLWTASRQIRYYLSAPIFAQVYDPLRVELEDLLQRIEAMRAKLDGPLIERVAEDADDMPRDY
jgi:hypothetical protein